MTKFSILAGAALLAVSGAAFAQPGPGPVRGGDREVTRAEAVQHAQRMFDRLDLDRDGTVTREEARSAHRQRAEQRMERRFQRMDLDGDGAVTLAEMRQARERMREAAAERRGERGHGMHGHRRGAMLGRLLGPDGAITAEEFRAKAAERFDRLDRDRTVTPAERRQARAALREGRMERHGQR